MVPHCLSPKAYQVRLEVLNRVSDVPNYFCRMIEAVYNSETWDQFFRLFDDLAGNMVVTRVCTLKYASYGDQVGSDVRLQEKCRV